MALARPVLAKLDEIGRDLERQGRRLKRLVEQSDQIDALLRASAPAAASGDPSGCPEDTRELVLADELIPLALKDPARARRRLESEARDRFGPDAELGRNVRATLSLDRLVPIPHREFWKKPSGGVVASATEDLIAALKDFSLDVFIPHLGPFVGYDLSGYLRQTRIRVIAALEEMARRGFATGRVLDVGSLYGAFALPLQRLGYEVTAVDRYHEYPGLEGVTDLLRHAGVHVTPTTRAEEANIFESLGTFDVVISMAVIEHIPHTPRFFLEGLRRRARAGGLLMIDTPNLVKYWNRAAVQQGKSTFMDLRSQYYAEIPFEGHHREYTGSEVEWLLEQIGCSGIKVQYLESNMFQFEAIDRPHLECLLAIVQDPTQADTLLASGLL